MEDFQQERKDREAIHEESSLIINRLERELNETKEKLVATDSHKEMEQLQEEVEQLQEEITTSNSQIAAYEKQLHDCVMELNEWRRSGHVMQDRNDALNGFQEQNTKPIVEVYVYTSCCCLLRYKCKHTLIT